MSIFKNFLIKTPKTAFNYSKLARLPTVSNVLQTGKPGDVIQVQGWVKSLRNQKDLTFIDLNDGSTPQKLQILTTTTNSNNTKITTGASIMTKGVLDLTPKGQLELKADTIQLCGECVVTEGYPFAPRKQYTTEYVRQYLHLRPATHKFGALLRVRSAASLVLHEYFAANGFTAIHTPILTANDCEGAGEVFKVLPENEAVLSGMKKTKEQSKDEVYFNKKSYLSVSGQMHLEAACRGLGRVYTFGPTFRAENSRSRLHLSEFYMAEAEVAFVDSLDDLCGFIEDFLRHLTVKVLERCQLDVELCSENGKINHNWLDNEFPRITYEEACEILGKNGQNFDKNTGLSKEHELFLVKKFNNIPVFVTEWPKTLKPFYMKENEKNCVLALDLLVPNVGELVGGSLRENNYEKLKENLPKNSQNSSDFDWYLDLRKFGGVPTAGFGLGFERYLQFLLGVKNIKDTIPFPRWPHNCSM